VPSENLASVRLLTHLPLVRTRFSFDLEGTAINHFPKVERREPGQAGPI
jgi:hypothetical protein